MVAGVSELKLIPNCHQIVTTPTGWSAQWRKQFNEGIQTQGVMLKICVGINLVVEVVKVTCPAD
jgi:hypothetical protein